MNGRVAEKLPRCGVMMRYAQEPCARAVGHRGCHKTRYAMDNAYLAQMGREPDPFVWRDGRWVPR